MAGRIIGPHIIGPIGPHLGVLGRWQPRMALLLDPDADGVRALRAVCPHTTLIGRIYRPDGEINQRILADPVGAARWAHGRRGGQGRQDPSQPQHVLQWHSECASYAPAGFEAGDGLSVDDCVDHLRRYSPSPGRFALRPTPGNDLVVEPLCE